MKKILLLASERIDLKSGGGMANRAFYDSLTLHYPGKIDIIQLRHSPEDIDHDNFYFAPELNKYQQISWFIRGHYHRLYAFLPKFLSTHKGEYSHCIINQCNYADMIPLLQKNGIKTIVIHHNYEVRYQMDNKLPSTLFGTFPYLVRRNERMALTLSDLNLYLTDYDRQELTTEYNIPNIPSRNITIGMFEPFNNEKKAGMSIAQTLTSNILAICGSLEGLQTENAIRDIMLNYYSTLSEIFGDKFTLILAGRNPGQYIKKESNTHANICLKANPENIDDAISQAGIFLCPVNCGSGIKLRVMDGLRLGIPILIHEVSARGYEQFLSCPWFKVYNDAETFRNGLIDIIQQIKTNSELRTQISNAYRNNFSFDFGDERFFTIIDKFCKQ